MEKTPTGNAEAEPQVGATTDLPHDRITVQRFSRVFSTHTLERQLNAWFVPGQTAETRIERWLAEMEAEAGRRFCRRKGRDAFAFDPIESRYLEAAPSALQVRTPYSPTVVNEIREIRMRAGTRIVDFSQCLSGITRNCADDGHRSRRRRSAMSPRSGGRGGKK